MKRHGKYFKALTAAAAALVLCSGCNIWDRDEMLSELTISVTVSNTPDAPLSRATINPSDYVGAMHDGEKMQTLRIIIVRPDGTVEHNRYLDFRGASSGAYLSVENVSFEVYGPEEKTVYLLVNEEATRTDAVSGQTVRIVDYDFAALTPGTAFPKQEINNLQINLNSSDEELPSEALPMSECHTIKMPASDHHADLFVTRATVKFTYLIENTSGVEHTLSALTISKGSNIEYYIPRTEYIGDPLQGSFEISDYSVPNTGSNNNYYIFEKTFENKPITVSGDMGNHITTLKSIYLLEGKYTDSNDARNYSMSLTIDGKTYSEYFPEVSTLPRNTHVVVCVTIGQYDLEWTVDVIPYNEVILNPGFGQ